MAAVLILGSETDPQVERARNGIRAHGGRSYLCDTTTLSDHTCLSIRDNRVYLGSRTIPPIQSVYLRGLGVSPLAPECRDDMRRRPYGLLAQVDERRSLLGSALKLLEARGVRIVNTIEANGLHAFKPYQLARIAQAGVPVPPTLASADPGLVRQFAHAHGRVVYKPIGGGALVQPLTAADLSPERIEALALAPVLFQKWCDGISLRVYVAGRKAIAAAAIHSTELDYRRKEDAVTPIRLTADERRAAIAAAKACGMPFTGVDLIRMKRGFVVLECNPSPMFAAFEDKTGLDVSGPLARLLLA
ncbi:MAG: hypothetical protein AMXMBFR84_00450 [Candidatus Hydrogenedentota bacterium]